tara:strand:- start:293 stop:409 length:117 start_codon:yes stop_codon:yes gene_type:complete
MFNQLKKHAVQKMAAMKRRVLNNYRHGTGKHMPKGKGK